MSLVFIFCLTACDGGATNDSLQKNSVKNDSAQLYLINSALDELISTWEDIYEEEASESDGYFEIKNTRVIKIKENDLEEFENVDYIIEFVLYTDYFGSAPYYSLATTADTVVVYDNGDMEVYPQNLLRLYSAKHFSYDYSDIVKSVEDYGDKYNCVRNLK